TGVGAVTDGDGGDEHVVGAGARARPDLRAVLVHAVVVDEDGRGADVRVLADLRVADVGQVRHLRAGADLGVLRLDERPDLAVLAEHRVLTQVGERPDGRPRPDPRAEAVGAHDGRLGTDDDVAQRGVRADLRTLVDGGRPVELGAGVDGDVAREAHVAADPRARGADDAPA